VMQMHGKIAAGKQYPWSYGQAALDNYKAYAQLHTTLFPYLYTAARQATVDGIPPIRPLPLVAAGDAIAATIGDEYLLGDALLIAPVIAQATTTRSVYLPAGGWYDYWTNAHVAGGQTITWTGADATQTPIFVRDGAIVPRLPAGVQSLVDASYTSDVATSDGSLSVLIYPSPSSDYTLYDGTAVTCQATTTMTTIGVTSSARAIAFDVFSTAHPTGVTRDGAKLPEVAPDALADDTWTYDGQLVKIQLAHVAGTSQLVLSGTSEPTTVPDPGAQTGCGCASGGAGGAGWLLLAAIGLLRRRSRAR